MMELTLPTHITKVFTFLEGLDLPAWLVGGCLRDLLLGRVPKDWDFATPRTPEEVRGKLREAGARLWETGLKHGTLTFRMYGVSYEITTFRRDGPYEDFRRPKWVEYTTSLREDLARRDFTVNALAYSMKDGLSDPFGGVEDIERKLIRAVGSPRDRLQEDALRILRGIRFAGSLGFALDGGLAAAMAEKGGLLENISRERLASELKAMLLLPSPRPALELLAETGMWAYLAPEMTGTIGFDQRSGHHHLSLYDHMVQTVENVPAQLDLRLAAIFHDVAKPSVVTEDESGKIHYHGHDRAGADMAAGILNRLRFSHAVRDRVRFLIRSHMLHLKKLDDGALRRAVSGMPKPRAEALEQTLLLQKADLLASRYTEKSMAAYDDFARRCREVLESGCPLDVSDLAVKGEELEGLGIAPADRGAALKALLAEVLADPARNRRQILLELLAPYRKGKLFL